MRDKRNMNQLPKLLLFEALPSFVLHRFQLEPALLPVAAPNNPTNIAAAAPTPA
jgi:hypothetical protein